MLDLFKLHIGCGARLEKGWVNIDVGEPPASGGDVHYLQHDVRAGLPFAEGSCSRIYSEHFLEHLTREESLRFLQECHRVLEPVGMMRISVPSLEVLMSMYTANNLGFAAEVGWLPATACQLFNEGMRSWGHQFMYDFYELERILQEAGFKEEDIISQRHGNSVYKDMLTEHRPDLGENIVLVFK